MTNRSPRNRNPSVRASRAPDPHTLAPVTSAVARTALALTRDLPVTDLEGHYRVCTGTHPELPLGEHRTAAKLAERLERAGFETARGVGGTGMVGRIRNGDGPTVLLRADVDALPVQETTGLPYASAGGRRDARLRAQPACHLAGRHPSDIIVGGPIDLKLDLLRAYAGEDPPPVVTFVEWNKRMGDRMS